jgi:hypothetical protein
MHTARNPLEEPPVKFRNSSLGQTASTYARPIRHLRQTGFGAGVIVGAIAMLGTPGLAQASAITPKAFCAKIPAATVSSLFGQKVSLLGAESAASTDNDVCEFAKIVGKSISGVTMNYDYKATGTAAQDNSALGKEQGVSGFVVKSYASIGGGGTYSFSDTFKDTTSGAKIHESGMVSYDGANHYGVIVTDVLPTSKLAALLKLVVSAA